MMRMTREESQAATRSRLLAAAATLFAREGYVSTSVDRIAEDAGFSKGAFYSNFRNKEEIFLEVLETYGEASLSHLLGAIDCAADLSAAIESIASWATEISRQGNWPLLVLEHARQAKPENDFCKSQETVFRSHWRRLGERLARFAPDRAYDVELLGALVFELTYAPAMQIVTHPTAGDLIRLALQAMLEPPR